MSAQCQSRDQPYVRARVQNTSELLLGIDTSSYEPTNHLDLKSIIWLEQFLKSFPGALLMTSHDREFMTKIVEIDAGEIVTYSGNYDFYESERANRESNRQAPFVRQQAMLAKEQRFIERFKTHAAKAAQVQSRIKALDTIEKIELPKKRQTVKFEFRVQPRSGEQVAVIEDIHKSYGWRSEIWVMQNFL